MCSAPHHLLCSVLSIQPGSRPFFFTTCSIQCSCTSPQDSVGWTPTSPPVGPFSLPHWLPSSESFAWRRGSAHPVLQNPGTVQTFKPELHLLVLERQQTYMLMTSKRRVDMSPGCSSVSRCINVGSHPTLLCPCPPLTWGSPLPQAAVSTDGTNPREVSAQCLWESCSPIHTQSPESKRTTPAGFPSSTILPPCLIQHLKILPFRVQKQLQVLPTSPVIPTSTVFPQTLRVPGSTTLAS